MRRAAAGLFLALLVPAICAAKTKECTVRVYAEANEHDGAGFSTRFTSPATGKHIFLEKIPVVSERDIVSYQPYHANDGSYGALFTLDDHGRIALDTTSIERRGTFLYVFINGHPASELQIDRRVSDGKLYIASGLSIADVALIDKKWPLARTKKQKPAPVQNGPSDEEPLGIKR